MTPKRCASITSSATHQLCCKALGLQDLSQGVYDVCMRDKMRCDAIGLGAAPLFLDAVLSGLERERPGWLPCHLQERGLLVLCSQQALHALQGRHLALYLAVQPDQGVLEILLQEFQLRHPSLIRIRLEALSPCK